MDKGELSHVENGTSSAMLEGAEELIAIEEKMPLTPYVIFLSMCAGLAGFLFGYDTGVISVALPILSDDLGHVLSHVESEWVTASLSVGALVGALGGGALCDIWGRKLVLMIGDAWFVVGAVVVCSSYSVPQMIIGRVFLGFGVGIASTVAPVFIAEVSPTRFRAALISVQSIAITVGQLVSYALGIPLSFDQGWRAMFGIAIAPALLQAVLIHWGCPESPRYELLKGKDENARSTIAFIYKTEPNSRFLDLKLASLREVIEIGQRFREQYNYIAQLGYIARNSNVLRPTITAVGLCVFQQLSGFNTLMYYSATIFGLVGFDQPAATGLIVAGTNAFFTVVSMFIFDRVGKRKVLLSSMPFMFIALALASIAFWRMTLDTNGQLIEGTAYPQNWVDMMLGMMVLFIASYALGLGSIPWQCAELFPLELRGVGASLLSSGIWAANIVISATFLSILAAIGAAGAFGIYAGICFVGFIFSCLCYPEVSGLSLEEINIIYSYKGGFNFGIRKSREIRKAHKLAKDKVHRVRDLAENDDELRTAEALDEPSVAPRKL